MATNNPYTVVITEKSVLEEERMSGASATGKDGLKHVHVHIHITKDSDTKEPHVIQVEGGIVGALTVHHTSAAASTSAPATAAAPGKFNMTGIKLGGGGGFIQINGQTITTMSGTTTITTGGGIQLVIDGNVGGSVSTECGDIECKGTVSGDIQNKSGDVHVGGNVEGDAKSVSGDLTVDGNVARNAESVSGDVKIGGTVGGRASSVSGNVRHHS